MIVYNLKPHPVNEQTKSLWETRLWQFSQDFPRLILIEEIIGLEDSKKAKVIDMHNREHDLSEWDYVFVKTFYYKDEEELGKITWQA